MDVATMRRVFPGLAAARAAELNSGLNTALRLAGCTTVNRAAMFCAQVGEESISLTAPTELASGAEYEGRADLGNTHPGDGVRFKGRGFIQITGRFNYGQLSRWAHAKGLVPSATYFIDHPRAAGHRQICMARPDLVLDRGPADESSRRCRKH